MVSSCLLLWEQEDVDVGKDTTGGNGGLAHEFVELLVVADGELNVSWHNSGLLVVLGGVACELENLSCEVFEDGCGVDWSTSSNAGSDLPLFK